jgi:uncharacterized protein involved in cysteine biosynthesis
VSAGPFRTLRNVAIIAVVALLIALAPGGGTGLSVALWILTVAFFAAIAFMGYRMYREYRFTIDSLSALEKWVAYGSIGIAFVTFTATRRLFSIGGGGVLVWIALLGLASFGIYWVWRHQSQYG